MSNRKPKRSNRKSLAFFGLDQSVLKDEFKTDRFTWRISKVNEITKRVDNLIVTLNPTKGYTVSYNHYASMVQNVDALKELEKALIDKAKASMNLDESSSVKEAELVAE